jgi:hypothetical protein
MTVEMKIYSRRTPPPFLNIILLNNFKAMKRSIKKRFSVLVYMEKNYLKTL